MPSKAAKSSKKSTGTLPVKKAAAKSTGKSTPAKSTTRNTVASLSKDLKSLETRLKGADTKNRNALKSLESVVADLQKTAKSSTSKQKAELTRGLTALEAQMETYLNRASEQARAGVRAELAAVTAPDAGLDTLNAAIENAHNRLDQYELEQREATARLNRHIAGVANAVEKRLSDETKARQASAAALDAKINSVEKTFTVRVDQVELDTAQALEAIGDRVTAFASVLDKRSHASDADTAERLADLAKETQADFNTAQSNMTTRLEALETIAANWSPTEKPYAANTSSNTEDPRVDQMAQTMAALQDELNRMHARVATLQSSSPQNPTLLDQGNLGAPTSPPTNVVPISRVVPNPITSHSAATLMYNPYADAARALEAFQTEPAETAPPAPELAPASDVPPQHITPAPSNAASHIPQEFDPSAFQAAPPVATPPPVNYENLVSDAPSLPLAPVASLPPVPAMPVPPMAPPMASSGTHGAPYETASVMNGMSDPVMPAPLPVSTYEDPAYAEGNDMRAERIGGESKGPSVLSKLPITGRNLRVGALAAGVAVVGLFAAKTVLGGGGDAPTLDARNSAPSQAAPAATSGDTQFSQTAEATTPNNTAGFGTEVSPPLGSYADTRTPNISTEGQSTLDGAVAAGNPIAQFQKGLVQLRTGQVADGARLIRLAANRNQPAAQYRLAKLYESGTGVTKDLVTARELIERAAIGGNRIAMHDLGNYYAQGEGGLDIDLVKALEWFTKAAERGVVDSQFNVAFLREGNEGITPDPETALFWYYIAARQGDQGAPERIAALSAQITPDTQASIKARADRFNPKTIDEAANGIFRDVPWTKKQTVANAPDTAKAAEIIRVRQAQTLLSDLGYQIGGADGAAGPKTKAAIKQFEAVNGLPETGEVSDALLERLEIATGA